MSTQWIYLLGERSGEDIKVGRTTDNDLRNYVRCTIDAAQTTNASYVILAGVRGTPIHETHIKDYFAHLRRHDKGRRTEYFWPGDDITEYANWLRSQWFVTDDGTTPGTEMYVADASHWLPDPTRRRGHPEANPDVLIQEWDTLPGNLNGTPWNWMANTRASFQDFFTPPGIVNAARDAMGDIDLDAASHWVANKTHRIPDYFDANRSAFDNEWHGRVWLNPPYGDNAPWFDEIYRYVTTRGIDQLCMLSPMWAFGTKIARPVMELSSAFLVLTPTPKFWGNSDPAKTGKNHPHGIMYIGDHPDRFLKAFQRFGIPMMFRWDLLTEDFVPSDDDDEVG